MLIDGEKEIKKWKSITATNYRIIQKKGLFWTSYRDINYDHLSSIHTGRSPHWPLIILGIVF